MAAEYNILYFAAIVFFCIFAQKIKDKRIIGKKEKQSIHLTMITTYGVAYGKHSGIVQKEVKMEDLFK